MHRYVIDLYISAEEWLRVYRGSARQIQAVARCGTRIEFPAQWLRGAVSYSGVQGTFVLETDAGHRLQRLRPLKGSSSA